MKRTAKSQWRGNLKQGHGTINSESGALSQLDYSFSKRFGEEKGTNPEELIAAAHSSCFAMALTVELEKQKMTPSVIDVQATVSLENTSGSWSIPAVHLDVRADVPGADPGQVEEAAKIAKENCPISKLLRADITMDFQFNSSENALQH